MLYEGGWAELLESWERYWWLEEAHLEQRTAIGHFTLLKAL